MKKLLLALGLLAAAAAVLAATTEPSDWRYPKMLLVNAPKMPFRYFV
jgi:hypothetical protein